MRGAVVVATGVPCIACAAHRASVAAIAHSALHARQAGVVTVMVTIATRFLFANPRLQTH